MIATMLLAAAMGLAGPAATDPIEVEAPRSATVRIGDLDLSQPTDLRRLQRRLDIAIEEVCGSYANVVDLSAQDDTTRCRIGAARSAATQLAARPASGQIALGSGR